MQNESGLTKKEAEKCLAKSGQNEIKDISTSSPARILVRQVKSNFIVYLLVCAMAVSFFVGKAVTAYTILAIILMVVFLGFF